MTNEEMMSRLFMNGWQPSSRSIRNGCWASPQCDPGQCLQFTIRETLCGNGGAGTDGRPDCGTAAVPDPAGGCLPRMGSGRRPTTWTMCGM